MRLLSLIPASLGREFVVHGPSLIARAASKGLQMRYGANFAAFLDAARGDPGFADLAAAVGVRPASPREDALSDDQFAVAPPYAVVAFEKRE